MGLLEKTFSANIYKATYLVDEDQAGMRLDQFIQIYLPSFSREVVKKKIVAGEVQIVGRPGKMRPNSPLHFKNKVILSIIKDEHEDEYWMGKKIELDLVPEIIFEDSDLIVISKPPFMSTHPTGRHIFNCATVYFESLYKKTIHSVHRLDRETSGILLMAKNPRAANELTEQFEKVAVKKCYFFIARSTAPYTGRCEFSENARLGNVHEGRKRVLISSFPSDSVQGKRATTDYKILLRRGNYTLGLAFPHTGRQHQIRVHALINGLPLLGDKLYLGGYTLFQRFKDFIATDDDCQQMEIPSHALHALAIEIPYRGEKRTYISEFPTYIKDWMSKNIKGDQHILWNECRGIINEYFKKDYK